MLGILNEKLFPVLGFDFSFVAVSFCFGFFAFLFLLAFDLLNQLGLNLATNM